MVILTNYAYDTSVITVTHRYVNHNQYKTWTTRRDASHQVNIVLCTKQDTECDRQVMVVGRLLTTFGDDRCALAKLFLVQRLRKSSRGNYVIFGDTQISHLFYKYSPASGI